MLDKLPKWGQAEAKSLLYQILYAPTHLVAERRQAQFIRWCEEHGYTDAAHCLKRDWERLMAFYRFPHPHWSHLRTTNPVESPFAAVRLRMDAAKRFKKVAHATAVIWKMLMVAEQTFCRVKHPEADGRGLSMDGQQRKTEVVA